MALCFYSLRIHYFSYLSKIRSDAEEVNTINLIRFQFLWKIEIQTHKKTFSK